eukprot:scaffold669309_cov89-Prasinocladus_malaysianus.AAC.1
MPEALCVLIATPPCQGSRVSLDPAIDMHSSQVADVMCLSMLCSFGCDCCLGVKAGCARQTCGRL